MGGGMRGPGWGWGYAPGWGYGGWGHHGHFDSHMHNSTEVNNTYITNETNNITNNYEGDEVVADQQDDGVDPQDAGVDQQDLPEGKSLSNRLCLGYFQLNNSEKA